MEVTSPVHHHVERVSFHLLTPEQVRKLSVKSITASEIFDQLNHPVAGGLYDPAMGPIDKGGRCQTCGLGFFQCPGHFGHVDLAVPVYAPLTFAQMYQVLKQTCLYCHRFRVGSLKTQVCLAKLQLLDAGLLIEAKELDNFITQLTMGGTGGEEGEEGGKMDVSTVLHKLKHHVQAILSPKYKEEGHFRGKGAKSGAVAEYRQKVIGEFLKRASTTSNVCQHCRGYIPAIYRHAGTKIFLNPLRKNYQAMMDAKGMDSDRVFASQSKARQEDPDEDASENGEDDGEMKDATAASTKGMKFLTPMHVYEHLKLLWEQEGSLLQLMFGSQLTHRNISKVDHRIFFAEVIAVPPNRFRPPSVFGGDQFDHPQNSYLLEIIRLNKQIVALRSAMKDPKKLTDEADAENLTSASIGKGCFEELIKTWVQLQEQVNFLFDSSRNQSGGKMPPPGIKQILEKKEGLFRKHMMGKRVNYAARSVISPDPNIATSEIGVPMVFAKKLTYPEPVTEFNLQELRQAVINGPEAHPGASHVQMEDGTLANLENISKNARVALANQLATPSTNLTASSDQMIGGKRVMRHIKNGDIVLMNRQPTLHKPSIMAHKVRVLPGEKTIRMHYANCNTYNADFDGDEMNMHFPQNELARSEAYNIANTNNQYLVPTDGSPLRGLIQDHVVSGVILTMKDTWMDRETYQQLLFGTLPESDAPILTMPPGILKPQPLWSGKQVISTVLLNLARGRPPLNVTSGCKINAKMWGPSHAMEATVIVCDGYFCTGIADKSQFGASAFGITHAVYELYGPDAAGSLLTCIGRLLTKFDQFVGFTCRMDDLLLLSDANVRRRQLIASSHGMGRHVVAEYAKMSSAKSSNAADDRQAIVEVMERILRVDELTRGLDGAMKVKMNSLTSKIIETCLPDGQLRPFPLNNMSLMTLSGAKGSMVNFSQIAGLLGQQELEGRRVPIMVSGKTLPSFPAFDTRPRAGGYITQRFLTGIRPQEFFFHCMAGREGLIDTAVKTSRSGYLQRCLIKHLESLRVHYDHTVRDSDGSVLQFHYGEDGLDVIKQKYLRKFDFCASNLESMVQQTRPDAILPLLDTTTAVKASKKTLKKPSKYEPVLSKYAPSVFLGATSERFASELDTFLEKQSGLVNDEEKYRAVMWLKYMRSLVEPGEAVGLLAAQSIGEPSTQMTLNTFHFAGFGAKNVTLGIPRLREIIMTASPHIKTPSLTVPLLQQPTNGSLESAQEISKQLSKLTMAQVIQDIKVEERLVSATGLPAAAVNLGKRARVYTVSLHFIPLAECKEAFGLTEDELRNAIEGPFVRVLLAAIDRTLKRMRGQRSNGKTGGKDGEEAAGDLITKAPIKMKATSSGTAEDGDDGASGKRRSEAVDDANSDMEDDDANSDMEDASAKAELKKQAAHQEDSSSEAEDGEDHSDEEDRAMAIDEAASSTSLNTVASAAKKGSLLSQTRMIRNYSYDPSSNIVTLDMIYAASHPKLLLLDILERSIADVVIRQVPGIARCFPNQDEVSHQVGITTEGANIRGMWEYAHLFDLRHLLSNDIYAILKNYGVEAARATIVREIAAVFAVYGISVDHRHLCLIADYMTFDGQYRPFNRMGMASAPSPLLQMTFETTVGFLRTAALTGDFDDLASPSSRLVMGLPVSLGTGSFEIRQSILQSHII